MSQPLKLFSGFNSYTPRACLLPVNVPIAAFLYPGEHDLSFTRHYPFPGGSITDSLALARSHGSLQRLGAFLSCTASMTTSEFECLNGAPILKEGVCANEQALSPGSLLVFVTVLGACSACGKTSDGDTDLPMTGGATGEHDTGGQHSTGGKHSGGATSMSGGSSSTGGASSEPADFPCSDGSTIPAAKVCNGELDCPLGEEEDDCPVFYCDNGWRVPARQLCDGPKDCPDGEDELESNCLVLDSGFQCDGGQIPRRSVCDGTEDCADGSDEITCPGFLCHDGAQVIAGNADCDGKVDCSDESDELNCLVP